MSRVNASEPEDLHDLKWDPWAYAYFGAAIACVLAFGAAMAIFVGGCGVVKEVRIITAASADGGTDAAPYGHR